MIILTIRSDRPEAELALFKDDDLLEIIKWEAHRQLSDTIHFKIEALLKDQHKTWQDIMGIVVFKGPGSFTGLRIGISVANALAYSLSVPIIAADGDDWQQSGIAQLLSGSDQKVAIPNYGAEVHITMPKK